MILHYIKYDWIRDTFVSIFKFIWIYNKLIRKYKKLIKCSKKKFAFIYHQINHEFGSLHIHSLQICKKEETNDEFNSILKFQSRKMKIYKNNYFENEENLFFTIHVSLDYSIIIIAIFSYVFYTIVINIYYIHVHIAVIRQW